MKDDIKHFMHTYVKCQNTKSIYKKKYRLYKLPSIPNELWEIVSMDFMTQLPKWNGHHFGDSWSIFQVGKYGSNKNDCNNFQFNKVVIWDVG